MAVHIVNVRRAFGLLCRELAEVIHPEDGKFATYSFDSWRETSELRAEEQAGERRWIRAVNFEIQVPRGHPLVAVRPLCRSKNFISIAVMSWYVTAIFASTAAAIFPPICSAYRFPLRGSAEPRRPNHLGKHAFACSACNLKKGGRTPHERT